MTKCVDCTNIASPSKERCGACEPKHERQLQIQSLSDKLHSEHSFEDSPRLMAIVEVLDFLLEDA